MRSVDPRNAMHTWEQSASQEASYVEKALGLMLLLVLAVGCILVLKPFLAFLADLTPTPELAQARGVKLVPGSASTPALGETI
ncbi:hypothetical protein [Microvirga sp. CF3016]|uniref:hypothetical protein n=1 Tax=Microvirga sp. CF3016 TaxID=3110181 RepID=UPI002E7879B8|nr:hypothetical protein [Microvirga sp. CF3016]MEE1609797.1 hypothetical protein [Microvirga sp. CF3016]